MKKGFLQHHAERMEKSARMAAMGKGIMDFGRSFVRPAATNAVKGSARVAKAAPKGWMGHAGQIPGMAGGAFIGSMTGEQMTQGAGGYGGNIRFGGQTNPETGEREGGFGVNVPGAILGAAMGHRGFRQSRAGQTLAKPLNRAMYGTAAGAIADTGLGFAGYDTKGRGAQIGGWGGLATGLGSNRFENKRDLINADIGKQVRNNRQFFGGNAGIRSGMANQGREQMQALNNSLTGRLHQAGNFVDQTWHGAMDPITGAAGKVKNYFMGGQAAKAPAALTKNMGGLQAGQMHPATQLMQGAKGGATPIAGMGRFGRRVGQLGTVGTLGGMGAGMVYNKITGDVENAVNNKMVEGYGALREQAMSDADDYMQQRGMMNQQGQFDPTQQVMHGLGQQVSQYVNPLLQMMGHDPSQMGTGQKAMAMAGPAMMGAGMGTGNPLLMMAGAGMAGAPHFMQGQGLQHQPGQYNLGAGQMGGVGGQRNEFTAQQNAQMGRQQAHMSGQGYL